MATVDIPEVTATESLTVAELADRVGPVPLSRIRMSPPPGTAVEDDLAAAERDGRLCELIDGVLVEKAASAKSSRVGAKLLVLLGAFVEARRLGFVLMADGFVRLPGSSTWRAPDVAFFAASEDILETAAYPEIAPTLAVEVLSPGNTAGEIDRKVREYFDAGTRLVWVVDPRTKTARAYASPESATEIGTDGTLEGGDAVPGFAVPLAKLFA